MERSPIDVEDMLGNMHYRLGLGIGLAAGAANATPGHLRYVRDKLLELAPFLSALGNLAREHPERCKELWVKALTEEPSPFGGPPLGLPPEDMQR